MDELLDSLEWNDVERSTFSTNDTLPYATREATLEINGLSVRVYQLSDGRRIIDAEDLSELLGQ